MMVIDIMARIGHTESFDGSESRCSVDDDPHVVSVQLLTSTNLRHNVFKTYQSVVDMLDPDLQVIGEYDKSDFPDLPKPPKKGSSEYHVPCLATVLFFNGHQVESQETKNSKTSASNIDCLSKPDLLLNHAWNNTQDLESDFTESLDLNKSDVTKWNRCEKRCRTNQPFQRFEAILLQSRENESNSDEITMQRDIGFRKEIFDFEVAERTLQARKQLETWPWEFHHKADSKKGITQCHWNAQDFYAYQPERDVTRLYGDVIDTTKISKRKGFAQCLNDDYLAKPGEESDTTSCSSRYSDVDYDRRPISTTDFPLMGVREVHYGKQHLRYTLFVSDANWMYQVEFYRLILGQCPVTLRNDFCLFIVYCGENTDIQFAVKKLSTKQKPLPLCSTVLQFRVYQIGNLVPLLPNSCKPISKTRWQTTDHDGNIIALNLCPQRYSISDTANSYYDRTMKPLYGSVTSQSETRMSSEDESLSLERLDSFVEPELPERMPLLQSSLYSYLPQTSRFGSRYTSSHSAGSSSSTSPERRPNRISGYRDGMFSPTHTAGRKYKRDYSLRSPASRISESSDDPENTNFYRKAKGRRDHKRRSDTSGRTTPRARSKSSSRKPKQTNSLQRRKSREEEVIVFV